MATLWLVSAALLLDLATCNLPLPRPLPIARLALGTPLLVPLVVVVVWFGLLRTALRARSSLLQALIPALKALASVGFLLPLRIIEAFLRLLCTAPEARFVVLEDAGMASVAIIDHGPLCIRKVVLT